VASKPFGSSKKKSRVAKATLFFFLPFSSCRALTTTTMVNSRVVCQLSVAKLVVLAVLASSGR